MKSQIAIVAAALVAVSQPRCSLPLRCAGSHATACSERARR